MAITSLGVGSGLDAEAIVSKLVSVERMPIAKLQSEKTTLQARLSNFGKLQSYMSALRDAARKLTDAGTWRAVTATSANPSALGVSASDGAAAGSYSVVVDRLAMAQSVASSPFSASTDLAGSGVMTISLGQWNADQSAFTVKGGTTPVEVSIAAGDTLATVRDKINAAGAGVTASIVTDASGARLSIRSKDTGVENAFRIAVNDTGDGVSNDASGLSRLSYDPANAAAVMTRNQAAENARATINNLTVETASNTMSNVLDGLTLTLTQASATPVQVSVSQDNESMRKVISEFATAYNDAMKFLREQTRYDEATKKAGALQGDASTVSLMNQLRSLAGGGTTASSVFSRLTDIGLEPQKDGTLTVKDAKVTAALGNLAELKQAFTTVGTGGTTDGLALQFRGFVDRLLGADGLFETRTGGLNARIQGNSERQARMEDRVAEFEKRIRARYTALDKQLGQLSGLSSYVAQQVTLMNRSQD